MLLSWLSRKIPELREVSVRRRAHLYRICCQRSFRHRPVWWTGVLAVLVIARYAADPDLDLVQRCVRCLVPAVLHGWVLLVYLRVHVIEELARSDKRVQQRLSLLRSPPDIRLGDLEPLRPNWGGAAKDRSPHLRGKWDEMRKRVLVFNGLAGLLLGWTTALAAVYPLVSPEERWRDHARAALPGTLLEAERALPFLLVAMAVVGLFTFALARKEPLVEGADEGARTGEDEDDLSDADGCLGRRVSLPLILLGLALAALTTPGMALLSVCILALTWAQHRPLHEMPASAVVAGGRHLLVLMLGIEAVQAAIDGSGLLSSMTEAPPHALDIAFGGEVWPVLSIPVIYIIGASVPLAQARSSWLRSWTQITIALSALLSLVAFVWIVHDAPWEFGWISDRYWRGHYGGLAVLVGFLRLFFRWSERPVALRSETAVACGLTLHAGLCVDLGMSLLAALICVAFFAFTLRRQRPYPDRTVG